MALCLFECSGCQNKNKKSKYSSSVLLTRCNANYLQWQYNLETGIEGSIQDALSYFLGKCIDELINAPQDGFSDFSMECEDYKP